jgi:NhaP-type Na+/H+ or K+/H+ antiporter
VLLLLKLELLLLLLLLLLLRVVKSDQRQCIVVSLPVGCFVGAAVVGAAVVGAAVVGAAVVGAAAVVQHIRTTSSISNQCKHTWSLLSVCLALTQLHHVKPRKLSVMSSAMLNSRYR